MRPALVPILLFFGFSAQAQKLDHAGQIGLRAALIGEYLNLESTQANTAGTGSTSYSALAGSLEAGPTLWIDEEGDEISLRARWLPASFQHCESGACSNTSTLSNTLTFLAGFRKVVGREELKTFLDADLVLSAIPTVLGGLHLAGGVLWDPLRNFGAYASIGVIAEVGKNFRFRFEGTVGVQARFDLAAP